MEAKQAHTPGPLKVEISSKFPFAIKTTNAAGEVVFHADMPCHSSAHETLQEVLCADGMPNWQECIFLNKRAIADAHLRAAAPDLLAALRDLVEWLDDGDRQLSDSCQADVDRARAAIKRATQTT